MLNFLEVDINGIAEKKGIKIELDSHVFLQNT